MKKLRESILEDRYGMIVLIFLDSLLQIQSKAIFAFLYSPRFPAFVEDFFLKLFPDLDFPAWAREALSSVGIELPS